MKTRIFSLYLVVFSLLAVGCAKEEPTDGRVVVPQGYIPLFAHDMTSEGTKVLVDPTDNTTINGASWIPDEQINLNGTPYTITGSNGSYYLNVGEAPAGELYAIYPATVHDALGNDVVVVNGSTGSCAIDIRSLAVNIITPSTKLQGGYTEEVYFPMAAHATSSSEGLYFDHLTGGLRLTLSCSTAVSIDRLVITAENGSYGPALYKDIAPTWAGGLLPAIPSEHGQEDDQSVEFVSTMTLWMNTDGIAGVEIQPSSDLVFCIPMLAKNLQYLTIKGYYGDELKFNKTKDLGQEKNIERNRMYTIPEIAIN